MEQDYVVYDADGNIVQWGQMSEELITLNEKLSGANYLIGFGRPYSHAVDVKTKTIITKLNDQGNPLLSV